MSIDYDVNNIVAAHRADPQKLQQKYAQNPKVEYLLGLQRLKSEFEMKQRNQAMSQQQQPATIAQQREQEAQGMLQQEMAKQATAVGQQQARQQAQQRPPMPPPQAQGIAAVPAPNMNKLASGGVVRFAEGGKTDEYKYADVAGGAEPSVKLDPLKPTTNPRLGSDPWASQEETRRKQLEQMIKDGRINPEDVAALTNGEFEGRIENDRPVVEETSLTPRKAGENVREALSSVDLISPIKRTIGAAGDVAEMGGEFLGGLFGSGSSPNIPGVSTAQADGSIADTYGVLSSDRNPPPRPAGTDPTIDPSTEVGLGGSSSSRSPAGGLTPFEALDLSQYGDLPELNVPNINVADFEDLQRDYGQKQYDWIMDKIGYTPEERARIEGMRDERKGIYDRINDPERNRERALINRLVAAGGSATAGNMFQNMVKAGQRTENIQDRNLLAAQKDLSDFELENLIKVDKADRGIAGQYGAQATGLGMQRDLSTALKQAEMDWAKQTAQFEQAAADRRFGIEAGLKSQQLAVDAQANLLTKQRNDLDKYLAQYRLTTTDMADLNERASELRGELTSAFGGDTAIAALNNAYIEAMDAYVEAGEPPELAGEVANIKAKLDQALQNHPDMQAVATSLQQLELQRKYLERAIGFPDQAATGTPQTTQAGYDINSVIDEAILTPRN